MTDDEYDPAVTTGRVRIATADGPMEMYQARPAGSSAGAVVVLQEAFGVNAHIQDVTRRLAERGYHACAPDLFHRTGVRTLAYDQHAQAMPLIGAITPDAVITDIRAVLAHLEEHGVGADQVALVGFCFGGRAAFTAATGVPGLACTVAFYGPGVATGPHAVLDRVDGIDAPLLLHVGADDPTIPPDQVQAIDDALATVDVATHQYVYPDAGHAFACDARPSMYRHAAAELAWRRTHAFLAEHLTAPTHR